MHMGAAYTARALAVADWMSVCLLPLQGVLYGLTRHGRVLIADEMGVGKTVQALALAACYQVMPLTHCTWLKPLHGNA